jgi:hypothetical protein
MQATIPNMQLKLTKQPVTSIAGAVVAPERPGSLIWCYVRGGAIRGS